MFIRTHVSNKKPTSSNVKKVEEVKKEAVIEEKQEVIEETIKPINNYKIVSKKKKPKTIIEELFEEDI